MTNTRTSQSKVARLIEKYELNEQTGAELEDLWTGAHEERKSLRQLAKYFNKQLLTASMEKTNVLPLDGEVDNIYRILTSDSVSSGQREEVRNRLQREGINVDQLKSDFVTYQAIRSYLKEYRNAEYEAPSNEERVENVQETVQQLSSRTQIVTEEGIKRLKESSTVTLGEFRVLVDVNILCNDCNTQYSVPELLDQGGCNCNSKQNSDD